MDEQTGEDRRKGERRRVTFEEAVAEAAALAARKVAKEHRRKVGVQSFLISLLVTCAIAIPVALITTQQRADLLTDNATFNCEQWHEGAQVLKLYVESELQLARDLRKSEERAIDTSNEIYGEGLVGQILKEQDKLVSDAERYWTKKLIPRLDRLGDVNCGVVVTPEGPRLAPSPTRAG